MSNLDFPFLEGEFYIDRTKLNYSTARGWSIVQDTKYGPKLFDTYYTKEQAEIAAKRYGLKLKEVYNNVD